MQSPPDSSPIYGFHRLNLRERLFLVTGAAALLLFLIWTVSGAGGSDIPEPPLELMPVADVPEPPPAAPAPVVAAPAVDSSGILLSGIMGSSAILTLPGGVQRVVPLGREFLPGLTLRQLAVSHVIVASAGGDLRFELNRFGGSAAADAPTLVANQAGRDAAPGSDAALRRRTMEYRLGLQPLKSNGKVAGFTIKPGARLPDLLRAGMQPGDTLVSVNGSSFDEERMMELSWEIANSTRTELEYVRGGRRMKTSIGS